MKGYLSYKPRNLLRSCPLLQLVHDIERTLVMTTSICLNPEECCRELSRVWEALGIVGYDGQSCPEHVKVLKEELAANRACNRFTWKERALKAEAALLHRSDTATEKLRR